MLHPSHTTEQPRGPPLTNAPLSANLSLFRVLSLQSHVVHGYVGNKCAVFALQRLGFDVDPVNTVQFSNHTGYRSWRGEALTGDKLWDLFEGLLANDLVRYSHVLTGYINKPDTLLTVVRIVKQLKQVNPTLKWVCDPVMGDNGKLYVPAEMVNVYRSEVLCHADYLFPNQTEVEELLQTRIKSEDDALEAMEKLHKMGIAHVILKSIRLQNSNELILFGSSKGKQQYKITIPKVPGTFTGTGDLFSALILGYSTLFPDDLPKACHHTVSALYAVIQYTQEKGSKELLLIQSQGSLINPPLIGDLHLFGPPPCT